MRLNETDRSGLDLAPRPSVPLVSIVITCFNYAKYLGEAIDSALRQTHRPIEVIVVNDGSTDDSEDVAKQYCNDIEYVYQPNSGPPSARNTGIRRAHGDFVMCLDADDTIAPEYVRKCVGLLQAHPEVGFVYTQLRTFGRESRTSTYPDYDLDELKQNNFIHLSSMMRAAILRAHPYDETFTRGVEDWNLYLTFAEHGIRGLLLDEPLLNYRKHEGMNSMLDSLALRGRRSRLMVMRAHPGLYSRPERLVMTIRATAEPARVLAGRLKRRLMRTTLRWFAPTTELSDTP